MTNSQTSVTRPGSISLVSGNAGIEQFHLIVFLFVFAATPGWAQELLSNDAFVTAEITRTSQIDRYEFDASIGETVFLNVSDPNGTGFSPRLRLFNAAGDPLDSVFGSTTASVFALPIEDSGRHTVLVDESGNNAIGTYTVHFAKAPGANEKGLLPNDARRAASLAVGDIDTWTFSANAGDRIHLKVADVDAGSLSPRLLVYAPDGTQVFTGFSSSVVSMSGYEAVADGLYTVVVQDNGADVAGSYELYFARAPGANEGGTLAGSVALQGSIEPGDIDTFEFAAAAGATISLNVADSEATAFSPRITVYNDTGESLANTFSSSTAAVSLMVPTNGFYTVVIQDNSGNSGVYTLDFVYVGGTPPVRARGIVLDSSSWYLLGVPGNSIGTFADLFNGVFDLNSYADVTADDAWIIWVFEPDTIDTTTGNPGIYRKPELSEPVPQGTGFWVIHLDDTARRLNLPVTAADATGVAGDGCAEGAFCVSTPLATAPNGGWTIGAVPSTLSPSIDNFRFVTDLSAPDCTDGCTLENANSAGYSRPAGAWIYEQSTGNYRLLSGTDSVAPWTGFWLRTESTASTASPRLLLPVR